MTSLLIFEESMYVFYVKYLICNSNNPQKKDLSKRDLFKIDLDQVFPCFHRNKPIPPTHNPILHII